MGTKPRAPIEQLIESGKVARKILQEKGFESRKSVLDEILKTPDAPILPGIPVYLPHQWTIKAAQRILYDILLMWREECGTNPKKEENISLFWTFFIEKLREQEKEYDEDISKQPKLIQSLKEIPVLKDVFSPVRKRDNILAIQRFFVDSFAVSIVVKKHHSTSEFANWFLTWSQDLHALWFKKQDREKLERV